jgi:hypothetical protein
MRAKHGKSKTFEYNVWIAMRKRCLYTKHVRYHLYGGRGITICERWLIFQNFLDDMGYCPVDKGSIDRVDSNGNYEINNCRWILKTEQSANRRCVIKINGQSLEACAITNGISPSTLRQRVKANWPEHLLLKTPKELNTRRT